MSLPTDDLTVCMKNLNKSTKIFLKTVSTFSKFTEYKMYIKKLYSHIFTMGNEPKNVISFIITKNEMKYLGIN